MAAPSTPTHYSDDLSHRPDIFDIALLKTDNLNFQLTNLPAELFSDYFPIILDLNFNVLAPPSSKKNHLMLLTGKNLKTFEAPLLFPFLPFHPTKTLNKKSLILLNFFPPQIPNVLLSFFQPIPNRIFPNISYVKSPGKDVSVQLNAQIVHVGNLISSHRENEWFNLLGSLQIGIGDHSSFYQINRKLFWNPLTPIHSSLTQVPYFTVY